MRLFRNVGAVFFLLALSVVNPILKAISPPPHSIPEELLGAYTLNGKIPVVFRYFDATYGEDTPHFYSKEAIEDLLLRVANRETFYYLETDTWLYACLEKFSEKIKGKEVAIIGSVDPVYEAITLAFGGHPITIDYNKITSDDPRLKFLTVKEYEQDHRLFDAILSISSFEHDGLGRYGDPLNPSGDFQAMEKMKKMLKADGILFLAVPIGKDLLVWNAHRVYGKVRFPLLIKGWKVMDSFGFFPSDFDRDMPNGAHQPIFVLTSSCPL